jgi:hypothetical protein
MVNFLTSKLILIKCSAAKLLFFLVFQAVEVCPIRLRELALIALNCKMKKVPPTTTTINNNIIVAGHHHCVISILAT